MDGIEKSLATKIHNNNSSKILSYFLPGLAVLIFLFIVSRYNYLIFHTLAELFSIVVAWTLFIIVWNTKKIINNDALVFLGIAYLFIGGLDLFHTLSYKGMGVLGPELGSNPATQLWIIARYMESISLCLFPFLFKKRIKLSFTIWIYVIITAITLSSIFFWEIFPNCYIEDVGLTLFKINSEYIICIFLAAAFFFLTKKKDLLDQRVYKLLSISIILTILGELAFTFYVSVFGLSNLIGHFFKIISFFFIYLALIRSGLKMPYETLFFDLKNSEKKHRKLISNISDVIVILDKDGIITYKSPNITEQFGWSPDDLIGKHGLFTVHPDDQEKIGKALTTIMKDDYATTRVEYNYLCKDGSFKPVELTAVNMVNDPIIKGVLANYKDITHRIQANEELRKSEEKYKATFRTSPDAINLNSVEGGVYIDINEGFTKILGYSREDIIGTSSIELNIWNDPKDRAQLISGLKEHGVVENLEADFIGKDGQIRTGLMSASLVNINNKNTILSITRDITEQRKLETQLQQSQKMESIGTLAGGIAHDFNNILFPIVGHTEMMLEDIPENSEFRDNLNHIYAGALRASELVKQILTFSRQDSSDIKLMKMNPIIKEALKLIRSTIPTTIEIKQYLQSDCGAIKADPTQIHQIVMNLSTNAYHAMEENGGELNVKLKEIELEEPDLFDPNIKPGAYACLSISDTGKGMDNELIEKIFNPFFTTKEIGKGTGMGLSVVHGIVKSMHGAIKVSSNPDKGTKFHVYLPIAEAVKEQQVTNTTIVIQGGTEHILLVDDEQAIIGMEQNMLERLGYKVTSRSSSLEALEAFRAAPDKFDLVITDMAMPNMSGDKLSIELTKIRPDIPILLCTGFSETMSEEKATSLGINGFLLKPIVMKDLAQNIREVLDK
jgi:PAS domain S-box-containing protein